MRDQLRRLKPVEDSQNSVPCDYYRDEKWTVQGENDESPLGRGIRGPHPVPPGRA